MRIDIGTRIDEASHRWNMISDRCVMEWSTVQIIKCIYRQSLFQERLYLFEVT